MHAFNLVILNDVFLNLEDLVKCLFSVDLAFKKNPPAGYQMKPVDIIGSLTKIVDNLTTDIYPNEYAWQVDTFKVFASAKDGHL